MCNKSIICGVLFSTGAITLYEGNNMLSALAKYVINRLIHGLFHIALIISSRLISSLGIKPSGPISRSRADNKSNMKKVMYQSINITNSMCINLLAFVKLLCHFLFVCVTSLQWTQNTFGQYILRFCRDFAHAKQIVQYEILPCNMTIYHKKRIT